MKDILEITPVSINMDLHLVKKEDRPAKYFILNDFLDFDFFLELYGILINKNN